MDKYTFTKYSYKENLFMKYSLLYKSQMDKYKIFV